MKKRIIKIKFSHFFLLKTLLLFLLLSNLSNAKTCPEVIESLYPKANGNDSDYNMTKTQSDGIETYRFDLVPTEREIGPRASISTSSKQVIIKVTKTRSGDLEIEKTEGNTRITYYAADGPTQCQFKRVVKHTDVISGWNANHTITKSFCDGIEGQKENFNRCRKRVEALRLENEGIHEQPYSGISGEITPRTPPFTADDEYNRYLNRIHTFQANNNSTPPISGCQGGIDNPPQDQSFKAFEEACQSVSRLFGHNFGQKVATPTVTSDDI